ncbi:MAG: ATP-binding protein, partial [Acidimicrobiales bacterium]
ALTSRIKAARRAIGDDGTAQNLIRTVHGRGYEFIGDVLQTDESATPVPPADDRKSDRIPAGLTGLVGRTADLAELGDLLTSSRLLTLVGPGGVGKTSLAYELARTHGSKYKNGVWVVELLSVSDPSAAIDAVATTLDVQTRQGRQLDEAVVDVLAPLEALIVLDNLEHVIEPISGLITKLLPQAPDVTVLTTSREALRVAGEQLWHVQPLSVVEQDPRTTSSLDDDRGSAVALFVERAQGVDPSFNVSQQSLDQVARICEQLDGMPLAIELAAARTTTFDVFEINNRLDERFRILRGTRRDADPRHVALADSFAWSYEMLNDDQRAIFDRLSVFVGPFGLQGVEAVCDTGDVDVIETLSDLVDRSMVTARRRPGRARYELLETLRAFGAQNLGSDEQLELRDRHADYYLHLARQAEVALNGPDEGRWSLDMADAFANLRAAQAHLLSTGATHGAFELITAVREYSMRAMRYEILSWSEAAMTAPGAEQSELHPAVKAIAAYGSWIRGEFDRARDMALEVQAEELERGLAPSGIAERVLVNVYTTFGEGQASTTQGARQIELAEAAGEPGRLAHAHYMNTMAVLSREDADPAVGRASATRSLEIAESIENPTALAGALYADGFANLDDAARAHASFTKSEEIATEAGNRWMGGFAKTQLILESVRRGDTSTTVRTDLAGLIDQWFRAGDWGNQWPVITLAMLVLEMAGSDHEAAQLIGALEENVVVGPPPLSTKDQASISAAVQRLRDRLGDAQFDALRSVGAGRPVSDVVALAESALLSE